MKSPRLSCVLAVLATALCGITATPAAAAGYRTEAGRIHDPAGQEIQLRGISHFGFNADILQPQYLWSMGWKEQIAQIKSLGFNAVRVPFVPDTLYVTTPVDQLSWLDPDKNADLLGKTPLQVLDLWMAEAQRQGLYVLLDFHSVAKARQYPTWFVDNPADYGITWNRQAYSEDHWIRDLRFVAQRYAHHSRFIGIDLYNEPNGRVRWSVGDRNMTDGKYYWKAAAEKAAAAVLQSNPNLLIFVQGITANWDGVENSGVPMNWGENFQPQAYQPLSIPANKLVLSPHTYGPDVYAKSSFGAPDYPANLAADWDTLFGKFAPQIAVVVGEWGGRYGQGGVGEADVKWQNAFVDYLQAKGIRSSFYWCYTPNSGDTGGILTDALEVREDKMALLRRHWGAPPATTPQPDSAQVPGALAFGASVYPVAQNAGTVTLIVNRTGGSKGAVSVAFATASGTARARTDYTARSGTLRWAAGDASAKRIAIAISNATPYSGRKSFKVRISSPTGGATLGTPRYATVSITGSKTSSPAPAPAPEPEPAPAPAPAPETAPPPTASGTLSLRVQGNRFVDASGTVVQLRGVNYSGFEFAAIQGWSGGDPSGGQAGQAGGPKWTALQSWKANALRIPLNEASWQNRTCTDTSGVVRDADPADNYQAAVKEQVRQANAAGLYVILDLHWSAPGNTCPMLQTQMANADHSIAFWTSVANTFKNNPAVVFELFNEPFMNFGFSGDTWSYMMKGTNGSFSSYPATSGSGNWQEVKRPWAIASYQAMLDAVRATGATNVVLVGTMQYAQDLSGWLAHKPSDPLRQMGAAWHPYQKFQSAWDYPYPNFHPEVMDDARRILAAGIPIVMTEVGGRNTPGTPSSPIVTTMTDFADANGIGVLGWGWGVWGETDHVLIRDVNGTPTDGYGRVYRDWMLDH